MRSLRPRPERRPPHTCSRPDFDLRHLADVIVEVPKGTTRAVVRRNTHQKPGCKNISALWYYHHELALLATALLGWKLAGSNGTLAAVWLACGSLWLLAKGLYH